MLTKPGQPFSPEHLSFKLSLPFRDALHNPTAAAASPLPLPAQLTVVQLTNMLGDETEGAETGLGSWGG